MKVLITNTEESYKLYTDVEPENFHQVLKNISVDFKDFKEKRFVFVPSYDRDDCDFKVLVFDAIE